MTQSKTSYILTVTCPDTVGIVAAVAGYLRDQNFFVEESAHYGDRDTGNFFSRARFTTNNGKWSEKEFREGFNTISEQFDMQWDVHDMSQLPRVMIMVSKHEHCLNDLLYRYRTGALCMEIPAIVSNHEDLRSLAEWHDVPYYCVPVDKDNKASGEQQLLQIVKDTNADLVVLARYMQVLSDDLCQELAGHIINIHHSFLPGFKGARPYQKAHDRGVKLIGATAHYVTPDLDEGPIIEQVVERVDHTFDVDDLVAVGRDAEAITLARAVKYHIEHRVFVNGQRTVVFR
ncbi:MAG: formyltetrahydrofolate deformylase [Gammaproteobacteria bacterium]|jgi:formyltetrahydrofolate deformylase|nr:formyltetrahydrofolate deformylase [Gammaproteobacteria bacterium]MDP6617108.1 formyltetrahydrofolate deformylase [Gammaproteobacteria bacterium]MDP6695782.1 formyltetrahydrofolate deformylase [Gammaproteobacteria bacterium]